MFNYRSNQQGVRPVGASYFRTPPGQRPQRQSFNRQIPTSNKSATSNKPMGSKPPLITPTSTTKQSEDRTTQESKHVFIRPTVEQSSSSEKSEVKTPTETPLVQQNTQQSLFKSADASTTANPPQPPSNPPMSDSPPPLPPSVQPASSITATDRVHSNRDKEPREKEPELSWSPPPPDPTQKPLTIPLASEPSQRDTQVPFGATLSQKAQLTGTAQSDIKEESAPIIQNEPPFQSQFIKGYQSKKVITKSYTTPQQPLQQKSQPHQEAAVFSETNKQLTATTRCRGSTNGQKETALIFFRKMGEE